MGMKACLWMVCLLVLQAQATRPYFRGGALEWRVDDFDQTQQKYNVSFTYRLTWKMGHGPCGPRCNAKSVGLSGPPAGNETFICELGCKVQQKLGDTAYTVTAVDQTGDWEHGVGSFNKIFDSPGPFLVSIHGNDWIHLVMATNHGWRLETDVRLGVRSDTGRPNSSPLTFNMPVYTMVHGCPPNITIAAMDPDGDRIRCRFGRTPRDCGGVCNSLPGVTMIEEECLIIPKTLTNYGHGYFAVSVIVEDFPYADFTMNGKQYNTKTPISQSTTQFLVYIPQKSTACTPPRFTTMTWPKGKIEILLPKKGYTKRLCANPKAQNEMVMSLFVSGPVGMTYKTTTGGTKGSLCVDLEWTPTAAQVGSHMICVAPQQTDGLTTEPQCVKIHVDGVDKCKTMPCVPGLSCLHSGNRVYCANVTATVSSNGTEVTSASCLLDVLDLVFVLDSSNSLTADDKAEMKAFVKRLVDSFGVDVDKTHIGVMVFGSDSQAIFHLGTHTSKMAVKAAIDGMQFTYGATDTGGALRYLTEEMFTAAHGDRDNVPNVAIVLTDGQSKDEYATQTYAQKARDLGISIFAVGVGPKVDAKELRGMSSAPADQFSFIIHSFADLNQVGDKLVNTTCSVRLTNTSMPPVTTERPGCYDRANCLMYGEDVCTDYPGWSSYHCRQWCGHCNGTTTTPPCKDALKNCVEYGPDICTKPSLRIWAMANCRAYCGFSPCAGTPTKPTTTVRSTTPGICRDHIPNCDRFGGKSVCNSTDYAGWARDNCADYCGFCAFAEYPPYTIGNIKCPGWRLPIECKIEQDDPSCCAMPKCPPGYKLTVEKPVH